MVKCSTWIQTFHQGVYDYASPSKSTKITPSIIAHSLSRINRFLSHSRHKWTVAEHSMLVRDLAFELITTPAECAIAEPYLLLHDAHEAFTGDMPAPMKKYILELYKFDMRLIEDAADQRIRTDLGLSPPLGWVKDLIRECDNYALKFERDAFMLSKHEWVIDDIAIPSALQPRQMRELSTISLTRIFRTQIEEAVSNAA